jgi:MFS family permease
MTRLGATPHRSAARTRRRRSVVLLEVATFMSGVGNGITSVALPWLVLERTGSAAAAGLVAAATAVPLVLVALFSGSVVDLVGRRRTAIVSDLLSAVSVLLIPVVDAVGDLTVGILVALAVLGALFDPAGASARESMLPEAAAEARWTLDRANGIHETVYGLAFMVGPGLGGLLIATVGASSALVGTGVAFALAALCVVPLRRLHGAGRPRENRPDGVWRGTIEGLRFVVQDPLLRPLAVLVMLVVALYYPVEGVILPVHFTDEGAPQQLGTLLMAMSAGMVVGSLSYERLVLWATRRTLLAVAVLGAALSLLWMAFLPAFGQLLVAGALSGMLWGPVQPLLNHAMQLRTPHHLRGRVFGTITSASLAAGPAGFVAVGFLVQAFGARPAFLGLAAALLVVVVAMLGLRAWALLDAPPVPGSAAADHDERTAAGVPPPLPSPLADPTRRADSGGEARKE